MKKLDQPYQQAFAAKHEQPEHRLSAQQSE